MSRITADILIGYVLQAAVSSLKFCLVIVPVVVIYELLKDLPFFSRQGRRLSPLAARLHFSPESIFPLSAGLFLGLVYGAGILISASKERSFSSRDILVLSIFLSTCHAVVEDTLLFVVAGGNGWWILVPRILIAVVATYVAGRIYGPPKAGSMR